MKHIKDDYSQEGHFFTTPEDRLAIKNREIQFTLGLIVVALLCIVFFT